MKLSIILFFYATAGLLGLVAAYQPPTFEFATRDLPRVKIPPAATDQVRSRFTVRIVDKFRAMYPQYNVVVCHTKHHYQFSGEQGKDWSHAHQELPDVGNSIGYEIYWFKSGTFFLDGDGGYINWAYGGNAESRNGKTVVFGPT